MDKENIDKAEAIRRAYEQAKQMKAEKVPSDMIEDTIKNKLIESGIKPAAAVIICSNLPGVRKETEDSLLKSKKNMTIGALFVSAGISITWISEFLSIKKGMGYYIIALGPIFIGVGVFITAVFDYKKHL